MPPHPYRHYLDLRARYLPERVKLVLVAESPPISGRYLYDASGRVTEPLFAALARLLGIDPQTKEYGLRVLQRRGWVLVDATCQPVNAMSGAGRNAAIVRDYERLREDLSRLIPAGGAPVALIKANVCALLEPRLEADGFTVANAGCRVPFPAAGQQKAFHRRFVDILRRLGFRA